MSVNRATLPGLPTDIKLIILCYLVDFKTLCFLLESSEAYCDAFQEYPRRVLLAIQKNEYLNYRRACIPDALALIASTVLADDTKPKEDVRAFISLYRKTTSQTHRTKDILEEISAWFTNSDFPVEFNPEVVQQMCGQRDTIEQLADDFLSDLDRRLPPDASVVNSEPSETERARARQALYRLWIHWNLFRPRVFATMIQKVEEVGMEFVRTVLEPPPDEMQCDFISSFPNLWDAEAVALAFRFFHSGVKNSIQMLCHNTAADKDDVLNQLLRDSVSGGFANHLMCTLNPPQLASLLSNEYLSWEQQKEEFVSHAADAGGYYFRSFGNVLELTGGWYSKLWRYAGAKRIPPKVLCRDRYRAEHWERLVRTERAVARQLCIWDDIRLINWGYRGQRPDDEESEYYTE